jgi:hypothetical protein
VACPFFRPTQRLEDGAWLKPPRLPLGDPWRGVCTAEDPATEPSLPILRELCNTGYARGRCERFPSAAESDAARFSVTRDEPDGVTVTFILERDYAPFSYGTVRYKVASQRFDPEFSGDVMSEQAQRFIESYLSRRLKS